MNNDYINATEKHVIECCLAVPAVVSELRDMLDASDFYDTTHRTAYEAILKLNDADRLDLVGFFETCPDIAVQYDATSGTANAIGHAAEIKKAAYRRKIDAKLNDITQTMTDKNAEPQQIYDSICELALHDVPGSIDGIIRAGDFFEKLMELYDDPAQNLYETGVNRLNDFYKVKRGDICLIGGIPGSGKSEFLDWLLVNEAQKHNWKFAYFSPENHPIQYHLRKIIEKFKDKTFIRSSDKYISNSDVTDAMTWINEHFFWVYPKEQECTPEGIMSKFKYLIRKEKIDGIVIDPWNELDMQRPANIHETDYIKVFLTKLRRFSRQHNLVTYVVVHPHMMKREDGQKYPPPSLYDYAGSAHWRNKTDVALCVHREQDPTTTGGISPNVDVYVQKVRFKAVGKVGKVTFEYHYETGRYV